MLDFDTFSNFTKFARLSFLSNGKSERYYWVSVKNGNRNDRTGNDRNRKRPKPEIPA